MTDKRPVREIFRFSILRHIVRHWQSEGFPVPPACLFPNHPHIPFLRNRQRFPVREEDRFPNPPDIPLRRQDRTVSPVHVFGHFPGCPRILNHPDRRAFLHFLARPGAPQSEINDFDSFCRVSPLRHVTVVKISEKFAYGSLAPTAFLMCSAISMSGVCLEIHP